MPVICSNIRGNSDLIEDGKGWYLVKPDDVEGFGKVIGNLIIDEKLKYKFSQQNHKKIRYHSVENILYYTERIYSK